MKKTSILTIISIALLLVAAVLGTVAYLTYTDDDVNIFTMGKVYIDLNETQVNEDGQPIPGADRVKGNEYKLVPGRTYVKDPVLTVKAGSEEAFVRMLVTVNYSREMMAVFGSGNTGLPAAFGGYDPAVWTLADVQQNTADGTVVYEFRYKETVKGDREDKALEPLFTSFTVPAAVQADALAELDDMEIKVVGNAMQAAGFADADAAWKAFEEQNT